MSNTDLFYLKKVLEEIKVSNMTEEEQKLYHREKNIETLAGIISNTIYFLIISTIIWAILNFIVGYSFAWIKVAGLYMIFNFLKNLTIKTLKN